MASFLKNRFLKSIDFYRKTFKKRLKDNVHKELPEYLQKLVTGKTRIAELASGPVCTIGSTNPDVEIVPSDICAHEYNEIWKESGETPLNRVEYQDMEDLTYEDESFDIVHCRNALDHTEDASKAIKEMERVCKTGGWIYLVHAPSQRDRYGGHHSWNITASAGRTMMSNPKEVLVFEHDTSIQEGLIHTVWQKS